MAKSIDKILIRHWQRGVIALLCLVLVIVRMIWPTLTIDWISVVLVAIATLAVLLPSSDAIWPQISQALPYVKKVKVAGVEVELSDEIKKLSQDVDEANARLVERKSFSLEETYKAAKSEVLEVLKTDPRAALVVLGARIEEIVMIRLRRTSLRDKREAIPMSQAVMLGVENGVFPREVVEPFREFWELRNRIAHSQAFEVESAAVQSLVSIGLEILKLVSLEETDGASGQE